MDKPVLRELLVNGKVSVNKLARIASVATVRNQEFLAQQVKLLPKSALDTLVRDEKQNGLLEPKDYLESLPIHSDLSQFSKNATTLNNETSKRQFLNESNIQKLPPTDLNLSAEVIEKLLELQNKGIDINKLLSEFLEKRELKIAQKKEKIAFESQPTKSRYIPAATREILQEEFGTKCSIEWCHKEADTIHHTQRFAMARNHNPKFLAPLCHEHHTIAHSIDVKIQEKKQR